MPDYELISRRRFLAALAVGLLLGCLAQVTNASTESKAHQWSEAESQLLTTFLITETQPPRDMSNRVSNNPAAITLGHRLFFDQRLSGNGKVSCATCHQPDKFFSDGLATAQGMALTNRNTPSLVGAAFNTWFFHDGRADSLWSQALGPLENAKEHGGSRGQYARHIYDDSTLRDAYQQVFGPIPDISDVKRFPRDAGPFSGPGARLAWQNMRETDRKIITHIFVNIGKAIAAYESRLLPPPSRFDHYLQALKHKDTTRMRELLNEQEVRGLRLFIGKGRCVTCHSGPLFSDGGFHNIAPPAGESQTPDWGRYQGARDVLNSPFNCRGIHNDAESRDCAELEYIVTDKHETLGAMKTPSLRNVTLTAPYMHAGQYKTLSEVLAHYDEPPKQAFRQSDLFLDIELNEPERDAVEAFLGTLTSEPAARSRWWSAPEH